ncbi:unnamed protein product [Symbiodinium sp. CCMP2456]|nr:unnamed protein product [Symbiodinium sp. CCMP2456]
MADAKGRCSAADACVRAGRAEMATPLLQSLGSRWAQEPPALGDAAHAAGLFCGFVKVPPPAVDVRLTRFVLRPEGLGFKERRIKATLANVAHLELDMILPADREVELLPRPYTSSAVSFAAEAMFSAENSTFSTRPSTSACSGGSSRSFRPRAWWKSSHRRKGWKGTTSLADSSMSTSSSFRCPQTPQRDLRGYETFEQLLQPGWRTAAELIATSREEEDADEDSGDDAGPGAPSRRASAKRDAVVLGVGKPFWKLKMEQDTATKAEKPLYQQKRNALKQATSNNLFAMPGQLDSQAHESSSSASSSTDATSVSSDSVDPLLATEIGDLLPQRTSPWTATFAKTKTSSDPHMARRGGLDEEMIAMAEFAVAAQQAAVREVEEAALPAEALPGVYFGHLESPRSTLLPKTPRVGRLQKLEHEKRDQDNVHQRKLLCLPHKDRDYDLLRMNLPAGEEQRSTTAGGNKRKMASTWEHGKEGPSKGPLSPEEEERIKEEKAQYDDWRRQVLLCARHLTTHISRFETDPLVGAGKGVF